MEMPSIQSTLDGYAKYTMHSILYVQSIIIKYKLIYLA